MNRPLRHFDDRRANLSADPAQRDAGHHESVMASDVLSPAVVRSVQERAARAQPAERVEVFDGWWLRYEPLCGWWLGSVLPHEDVSEAELSRRVKLAEGFYRDLGEVARFQVTPPCCPSRLDAFLAERNYVMECPVSLRVGATADVVTRAAESPVQVMVDNEVTETWLDVWAAVHEGADRDAERRMLQRVSNPQVFAVAKVGDEAVAVGRAVGESGWAGVFSMATVPHWRAHGLGGAVMTKLARWAETVNLPQMYLQVVRENLAALRLYERAGLREVAVYHYRIGAPPPA